MKQVPIPAATPEQRAQVVRLVDYVLYLTKSVQSETTGATQARDELMKSYFEQLIDALVYELFFPEELHRANKFFSKHLAEERLPSLDEIKSDKIAKLRSVFERLFDKEHVIRKNCFFLDTLESVRIIEGKA